MNVIIVNDYAYVNGGASQVAINTAKLLAQNGETVVLFAAVGPIDESLGKIKNLETVCLNQYDILNNPSRLKAAIQGLWNVKARREFGRLLTHFNPYDTIIHIHTLSKGVSTSILSVAKKHGYKIVYHIHDYGLACPNLGFYDYQNDEICYRHALSNKCLIKHCDSRSYTHKCWRVVRQIVQNKIGKLLNSIDCYIYISKFSLDILEKYIGNHTKKEFLPNVINVEKKERIQSEKNSVIAYIGRLSPEKNPQMLAKVTRKLGMPVLFIGEGVSAQEIKQENEEAEITGWLSQSEVYNQLKAVRVVVFPSKWYETQGLTVIESLARGIPVIVSDVTAAKDEIINEQNGLLFSCEDEDSLIQSLRRFQDDALVEKFSKFAYDNYWTNYINKGAYIKRLKQIYIDILR